ncbi:type II toxin-antitoxin system RelE/ParE family toxin [Sphaerisporangium sp. NPDC049002]|uniref:type II toxin-antitoxin system RelE family toxin n=1 Tax=unclassified Sphaerisporangium TaxID=2630420 RepID=UPI003409F43E
MSDADDAPRFEIELRPAALRAIAEQLPLFVADAVLTFLEVALAQNPRRVGKELREPFDGVMSARRSTWRVLYRIHDGRHTGKCPGEHRCLGTVSVESIRHRSDAYRI